MDTENLPRDAWPECCDCDESCKRFGVQTCRPNEYDLFVVCTECGARATSTIPSGEADTEVDD